MINICAIYHILHYILILRDNTLKQKIILKILRTTHRPFFFYEEYEIALIKWAEHTNISIHSSTSLEVQATDYNCSKLSYSWYGKVKCIKDKITHQIPFLINSH